MTSMLEKLAFAANLNLKAQMQGTSMPDALLPAHIRRETDWMGSGGTIDLVELVRAVLVVLREPDEATTLIMFDDGRIALDAWRATIDAILGEKGPSDV